MINDRRLLNSIAVLLAFSSSLVAQRITGSVEATIKDPSGGFVPGAKVQVVNVDTQLKIDQTTDQNGYFSASTLPPGQYELLVDARGFKKLQRTGITLDVDQTVSLDLNLEVGTSTEIVQVTGEAPLLDTGDAEIGQVIAARSILCRN